MQFDDDLPSHVDSLPSLCSSADPMDGFVDDDLPSDNGDGEPSLGENESDEEYWADSGWACPCRCMRARSLKLRAIQHRDVMRNLSVEQRHSQVWAELCRLRIQSRSGFMFQDVQGCRNLEASDVHWHKRSQSPREHSRRGGCAPHLRAGV